MNFQNKLFKPVGYKRNPDAENILAAILETELNSISKNISKFKYNKTDLTNDFKPKLKISPTNLKSILPIEIIKLT